MKPFRHPALVVPPLVVLGDLPLSLARPYPAWVTWVQFILLAGLVICAGGIIERHARGECQRCRYTPAEGREQAVRHRGLLRAAHLLPTGLVGAVVTLGVYLGIVFGARWLTSDPVTLFAVRCGLLAVLLVFYTANITHAALKSWCRVCDDERAQAPVAT